MDLKEPQTVITIKIFMKMAKIVSSQQILQNLLIGIIVSQNSKKSG
jgi:hypothetical protein